MFLYNPDSLLNLEMYLSSDRLTKYMRESCGDMKRALDLYVHNTMLSAAFYAPLQGLEVTLRNALVFRLRQAFSEPWYDDPTFLSLSSSFPARITETKEKLSRERASVDEPHVVAGLSFGFWVMLLGKGAGAAFELALWRPHLRFAFPNVDVILRKDVYKPLDRLRKLRNRIAHHEPIIFSRDLLEDYRLILQVLGWISIPMRDWVECHHPCPVGFASAGETLAKRRHFGLTVEQWEALTTALDAEPRDFLQMKRLLSESSIFDDAKPQE